MDVSSILPQIWAQGVLGPPTGLGPGGTGLAPAVSLALLALRRWCGSLTLSSPSPATGPISAGLWAWLLGLLALLVVVLVAQGPSRALGQLFNVPGHVRLLGSAIDRVRRSGRLLMVVVGVTVVVWTSSQTISYGVPSGRDDELILIKGRRLTDVALDQGYLAALTPARDVVGLGLAMPLLVAASVVLFQFSTDRWGSGVRPPMSVRRRSSRWATIGWGSTALYALYRFICLVSGHADLPIGFCTVMEVIPTPILMALADGVLVAWVLVELRNAGLGDLERDSFDVLEVTLLIPSAALACFLAYPSRYVATVGWILLDNLPTFYTTGTGLGSYLTWQVGWGLVDLQGAAVVFAGIFGAVAWSRGIGLATFRGYGRLLANEGGHLVATLAAAGLAAGGLSAAAYLIVLSLPTSTWALNAADSYAHYATLPVGLILMAALIELGERSLPMANLAEPAGD